MQEDIKNIVFNPCGYTMAAIRNMVLHKEVSRSQLEGVLGADVVGRIMDDGEVAPLPKWNAMAHEKGKMDDATQVVFWGLGQSGKTLVVASLLSLEGIEVVGSHNVMSDRIGRMRRLFANTSLQAVPQDDDGGEKADYPVIYKRNLMGRAYPIIFTEAAIPATGPIDVDMYVSKDKSLIHVFCIDCRQSLWKQEQRMLQLMNSLRDSGYLDRTDGVYALVTKTDLMNAPVAYKDNAAQTLVTKGMPELWRVIQDVCFDKQINNVLPIPFSVGRFVVGDLAYLNAGDAEFFFRDALLPKCQPRRNIVGRVLSMGKGWQASLCALLLLCALAWCGYKAYEVLTAPPTSPMQPFDYQASFLEDVKGLSRLDYRKASERYATKRNDLTTERSLLQSSGKAVLSAADVRVCDSTLTNEFAKLLSDKCKKLFALSNWSEDAGTLKQLLPQLSELLTHGDVLEEKNVGKYHTAIDDYFKHVKPVIEKSVECKSIDDVDFVEKENGLAWVKYPYDNDIDVRSGLRNATRNAYGSCANYYKNEVDSIIAKYPRGMWSWLYDENEGKRTIALEPYWNNVNTLLMRLEDMDDSFYQVRNVLSDIKGKIKNNADERYYNERYYDE